MDEKKSLQSLDILILRFILCLSPLRMFGDHRDKYGRTCLQVPKLPNRSTLKALTLLSLA
jgi:hypothetical protein